MVETRDYKFGTLVLVITLALSLVFVGLVFWASQGDQGYYADGLAPSGWYHQRSYIEQSYVTEENTIFLPICDHPYLGPLHGTWHLTPNVHFPEPGGYNLRVENGIIVEVVLREKG